MKHPYSRSSRRHNGIVWRNRQRSRMKMWWSYRYSQFAPEDNNMWWARKQSQAHGNRCACNAEKTLHKRAFREGKDVKTNRKTFRIRGLLDGL